MPTPGPWQPEVQLTIPGVATNGGRFRFNSNATDSFHPGMKSPVEVNSLVNERRLSTDGGDTGTNLPTDLLFESRCSVQVSYAPEPIDGTHVQTGSALDQGRWFAANLTAGWNDYLSVASTEAALGGAAGYEIEGGSSLHIVSVDGADISIPVVLTANPNPVVSMNLDIYTSAAEDYTDVTGSTVLQEHRDLVTGYIIDSSGGTETLPPIVLSLSPEDMHPTAGGVHVYPSSSQVGAASWDAGSHLGTDRTVLTPSIWFHSVGAVTATYDVTFPRYRLLFEDELPADVEERVTRQYPRDDALGSMGSASRLYPPPRGNRVVGGHT